MSSSNALEPWQLELVSDIFPQVVSTDYYYGQESLSVSDSM
jgi:hypothetical protein